MTKKGDTVYTYTSKAYPELVALYKRWYPNGDGVKVVPKDLELSPIMARQWYMGKGDLVFPEDDHPYIEFDTGSFDKESVDRLVAALQKQGFKASRRPADNEISLSADSVEDFLKWIGPCPVSCYDYKWDIGNSGKGEKIAADN